MLDDKTFLTSVAALEAAADRLGQQTVTIQTDHLRRLREMAERASPRQAAPMTPELRTRLDADLRR